MENLSSQPPSPSDKDLSQKTLIRKIKIGAVVGIIIVIVVVSVLVYMFMNKGDLQFVNFTWTDNHPWFSSAYVHVTGTIFNSGSSTAGDVQLVMRIYNSQRTLLKTETSDIGDISAKEYKNISFDIQYSGDANSLEWALSYKPFT